MSLTKIAVLGSGTMGHGIAQLAAQSGISAALYDIEELALARAHEQIRANLAKAVTKGKLDEAGQAATLERLWTTASLEAAVEEAELVIEAIPEILDLKKEVFGRLDELCGPEVILATNTSGLSVSEIAAATARPERVVGMHFFNPPYILKLLEIVRAEQTSDATVEAARAAGQQMGREEIVVSDSPGFASSRLGIILALEAIRMVESGVAEPEAIDKAMTLGYRHPMGPLALTDLVGLDVRLKIAEYLHREIGEQFRPPQLLKRMVRAGRLGRKSGAGFYDYSGGK